MEETLKLSKENIGEWKALLTKTMLERYAIDNYGETISDDEWLENYEGESIEEAITDEIQAWEG